jgi:hypothetical protein
MNHKGFFRFKFSPIVLLAPDKSSVLLGYSIFRHGMPGSDQIYDAAITIAYRIVRELCGPSFTPLQVQFAHGRPGNVVASLTRSGAMWCSTPIYPGSSLTPHGSRDR